MNSNSAIQKGLILNGSNSVAVARMNDAVYRLQPIPEITPIYFENFKRDVPKMIDLSTELPHDYQVLSIMADFPEDDYKTLGTDSKNQTIATCRIEARLFRKGAAVANIYTNVGTYLQTIPPFFVSRDDVWEIKCRRDMNRIIFMCIPVITNKPITLNGVTTGDYAPSGNGSPSFDNSNQAT